ncbi:MAG: hypothetical protein WCK33_03390 [Phycisphaerae bacterium]
MAFRSPDEFVFAGFPAAGDESQRVIEHDRGVASRRAMMRQRRSEAESDTTDP